MQNLHELPSVVQFRVQLLKSHGMVSRKRRSGRHRGVVVRWKARVLHGVHMPHLETSLQQSFAPLCLDLASFDEIL